MGGIEVGVVLTGLDRGKLEFDGGANVQCVGALVDSSDPPEWGGFCGKDPPELGGVGCLALIDEVLLMTVALIRAAALLTVELVCVAVTGDVAVWTF